MLDRHGDIALHEIGIGQLGELDALPVTLFGHEQGPELIGHFSLSIGAAPGSELVGFPTIERAG
jgi:hypothetical protein